MKQKISFERFALAILKTYHRDQEAFWSAVMAPFLSDRPSLPARWKNLRVGADLLWAFRGLDADARQVLAEFSAPLGFDVSRWKSNRMSYFKDAYPIFAFLAVWMDEEGLADLLEQFGEILRAGVYAVAGYGILDENVDSNDPSPVEVLTAQALIAEYETLALQIFGITPVNLAILHRMRSLFLNAEIKEKSLRWKASPYTLDKPEECGAKGANAVTPFMLSLERLGRAAAIDDYWQVFLLFGAAIQVIDDWGDLEKDLSIGHYSYITLPLLEQHGGLPGVQRPHDLKDPKKAARLLRGDTLRVHSTYTRSKEMIAQSRAILDRLDDRLLVRLVDVTELRLETFFHKELRMD